MGLLIPSARLDGQGPAPAAGGGPNRIDVHHHMLPPAYVDITRDRIKEITPNPEVFKWTPAAALEQMDRFGIATSMLSLPIPGTWFGGREVSRKLARISNEYGATLVAERRSRFGLFASVPLPDVDGSLAEIAYAFDTLGADGIALQTSYDGQWPGDPAFASVFDELNRRRAVVFIHPTEPACCAKLIPGVQASTAEFLFDTTRAAISLLANGTLTRCPDIRFIFCHAGGTLPVLAARIHGTFQGQPHLAKATPRGVTYELRRLYYDVANATNPSSLAALMNLVPSSQIVWGSDYPYRLVEVTADGWDKYSIAEDVRRAIDRGNALRLFPRLEASH
jgi:predicted TIM-barrel fold metal-dependent hydrolase